MFEILLVHGTGVRRVAYDRSLNLVRSQAKKFLYGAKVHACLWGEPEGAKLRLAGRSIPTYDDQPAASLNEYEAEDIEAATWRMLREDPLFELRLLENIPAPSHGEEELNPLDIGAGEKSCQLLADLEAPAEFVQILCDRDLDEYWSTARRDFVSRAEQNQASVAE